MTHLPRQLQRITWSCVLFVLALPGCGTATLKVEVAVLNKDYLDRYRSLPALENIERQARLAKAAMEPGQPLSKENTSAMLKELAGEWKKFKAKDEYKQLGLNFSNIAKMITSEGGLQFEAIRKSLNNGIAQVNKARAQGDGQVFESTSLYRAAFLSFRKADYQTDELVATIRNEFDNRIAAINQVDPATKGLSPEKAKAEAKRIEELKLKAVAGVQEFLAIFSKKVIPVTTVTNAINSGAALRGDPLLSKVVRAPETEWTGLYNRAYAKMSGTNTDIAIVMDDVDKFSVKGLRADSTSGIKTTFVALGRVMEIASAVSGVPMAGLIPDPPAGPESEKSAQAPKAQAQAIVTRSALQQQKAAARMDLLAIADAILSEANALDDNAKRNTAMKSVGGKLEGVAGSTP